MSVAAAGKIKVTIRPSLSNHGKTVALFDERQQFKNPDYDVSFFTENAKLSPEK